MSTVRNVSLEAQDLDDGRLVAPGARASRVDLDGPLVQAKIAEGLLLPVPAAKRPRGSTTSTENPS